MPVYEYRCPKCDKVYEATRSMDERDKPLLCKKCGVDAERIMSGFASKIGFYIRPPASPKQKGKSK